MHKVLCVYLVSYAHVHAAHILASVHIHAHVCLGGQSYLSAHAWLLCMRVALHALMCARWGVWALMLARPEFLVMW